MNALIDLLTKASELGASDLHIATNSHPMVRLNGQMNPLEGSDRLSQADAEKYCFDFLNEDLKRDLKELGEINVSYKIDGVAKFRANIFFEGGGVGGHFRKIPIRIPALEELGFTKSVHDISTYNDGLVLISGPTRSGRSTTVASILNRVAENRAASILTVENPVEFEIQHKHGIVRHREIGRDVVSLETAVSNLVKQDVDVCFLGDIGTSDGYKAVTHAAAMGNLVIATCFAGSAVETLDNYFSGFSLDARSWASRVLANRLRAVVNQKLIPGTQGKTVLATEVLLPTPEIRSLIREENLAKIDQLIRKDQEKTGMISMNQSLMNLLVKRKIEIRQAFEVCPDPDELDQLLKKAGL